jgi:hypothetical protein
MALGELFLEALSTGVMSQSEIDWLLSQHDLYSRPDQAAFQRMGCLMD